MLKFPQTTIADIAFCCLDRKEMQEWIQEAKTTEFDKKFCRKATMLFYKGGKVPKNPNITDDEYALGKNYLRKWLGSFDPQHEEKELVTGYILSRISTLDD